MRKILSFMAILTLTAATLQPTRAQAPQDSAQDQSTAPAPTPDKDGVYQPGPGIAPPYITSPAQAIWPASTSTPTDPDAPPSPENANPPGTPGGPVPHPPTHLVHFTAVIGADGNLAKLEVVMSRNSPFEAPAAAAIRQTLFAPGTLNGSPVPVRVCMMVPFVGSQPAIPRIQNCPAHGFSARSPFALPPGIRPPRPTVHPNPEYSDQARKKRIQGVVLISLTVDEQGMPTDLHIERSLGYGLDEKALDCVSQYRFEPATKPDGTPVPAHIAIEVSFHLF
ncbi:MAG TPA: energy transducer TonB [Acidobacteriaceae bacterium]|jgi:TonB family protein|nr:energy transducer TonB [Acidobacteriaceae bacterium]